ncbi:hypothetical protein AAG906_031192 [Vitis piasezkii]
MLSVKYILPFKDQPELLKRPPIKYTFIRDEEWTMFVKDRLSSKERRKKHIYNHHLSRKGYAGLEEEMMVASGLTETIDRSILWKKAREKKDGTFDEVAIPVIEKIDKLLKESEENGRSVNGSNDILVEALGTPEYSGRVRAKGKHHTPRQYFNTAADRAVRDFIATSQEEQRRFQAEVLAKLSQVGVVTPHSDVRKCELAMGTKENKVGGGTIILECGPNYLVVVDVPYDASAPLPIPILDKLLLLGCNWLPSFVASSFGQHPYSASKKGKKETVNEVEVKSKSEKPQDVKNFESLVGLMLASSRAQPIDFPNDVFGESFKTFLMKEDMDMIISSKEVSSNCILFYICGMGEGSKENITFTPNVNMVYVSYFHWVLVALEMKRMIAYYLDPMASQPCDDLKEIVNMAIRINPPEKQKTSKREPTWVKVVCPRQPGSVECGYYVMRYMKEIIANPNQLASKFDGRKSFSEMEINEVRSDWIMLMTQLIITHA